MLCPCISVKLTKCAIKYPYIVPKIQHRQKSFVGKNLPKTLSKNSPKIQQKTSKNPLKICDKNFLRTKIFYVLTKI